MRTTKWIPQILILAVMVVASVAISSSAQAAERSFNIETGSPGEYRITPAMLDGDDKIDFIIIDVYPVWQDAADSCNSAHTKDCAAYLGQSTAILMAYDHDGNKLWSRDTGVCCWTPGHGEGAQAFGWNVLPGLERDEVIAFLHADYRSSDSRHVNHSSGPFPGNSSSAYSVKGEQGDLAILNGRTGQIIRSIPWPKHNDFTRHHMTVGYLDGQNPSIITQTSLYCQGGSERLVAYDPNTLSPRWDIRASGDACGGAHNLLAQDLDGDGIDEVLHGTTVFNADGTFRWDLNGPGFSSSQTRHPDIVRTADFDPDIPGIEVFFCVESDPEVGAYLTQADGTVLWDRRDPYFTNFDTHCHSGWIGDIDSNRLGIEFNLYPRDVTPQGGQYVFDAKGNDITASTGGDKGRSKFSSGHSGVIADIIGGYGDEQITGDSGRVTISGPVVNGPPTAGSAYLMSGVVGRNYRQSIVRRGTGYWYRQPLPGEGNTGFVPPPPSPLDPPGSPGSPGSPTSPTSPTTSPPPVVPTGGGSGTPDLNADNRVDYADLAILLAQWGTSGGTEPPLVPGQQPGVGIVVDNNNSNNTAGNSFQATGTWTVSGYPSPYANDSIWGSVIDASTQTATWAITVPAAGEYDVAAWWTSGVGRITDATYEVGHAGGSSSVCVNQQQGGGRWNILGTYTFNAGVTSVKIDDTTVVAGSQGDRDSVAADAIWIAPKGAMTGTYSPPGCLTTPSSSPPPTSPPPTSPPSSPPPVGGGGDVPPGAFRVAFIGDQGIRSGASEVLSTIRNNNAQALVIAGDLGYGEDDPQTPTTWKNMLTNEVDTNVPIFAVIGNHDEAHWNLADGYNNTIANHVARAESLGATCSGTPGLNYECIYNGIQFAFSGSQSTHTVDGAYLEGVLSGSSNPWKVCAWHHNQRDMQAGGKSSEAGWSGYQACERNGAIIATGHEHSYSRTKTLANIGSGSHGQTGSPNTMNLEPGQTFAFVSGLGGASRRDYHCEIHEGQNWWASIFAANYWLENGTTRQKNCTVREIPGDVNSDWEETVAEYDHGALFIDFNVDGDPYKAQGFFETVNGQVIDSFDIFLKDTFGPVVQNASIAARSINQPVVLNWEVSDHKSVQTVDLQVTNDASGAPNNAGWSTVDTQQVSGATATGGSTHNPSDGVWWYRIQVTDTSGNAVDSTPVTIIKQPGSADNTLIRLADSVLSRGPDFYRNSANYGPEIQSKNNAWNWDVAVRYYGVWRAYEATGDVRYKDHVKAYLDDHINSDGTFAGQGRNWADISSGPRKANEAASFYLALEMYEDTGEQKYLTAAKHAADNSVCNNFPRTAPRIGSAWQGCGSNTGGFDHNGTESPQEYWLDTVFMTGAYLAKLGEVTGDARYSDEAVNQVITHVESLKTSFPNDKGVNGSFLLMHAWDSDSNATWIGGSQNGTNPVSEYWGRGNAWVPASLVDILSSLPSNHPRRGQLVTYLNQHLSAAAKVQDVSTGRWWTMLDDAGQQGNYLENSATALFLYAMQTGSQRGYLTSGYTQEIDRALNGLLSDTTLESSGTEVRNVSAGTIPGDYNYYVGRLRYSNVNWGDGAALMAYSRFHGDSRIAQVPSVSVAQAASPVPTVLGVATSQDVNNTSQQNLTLPPVAVFSFLAASTGFAALLGLLVRKKK